MSSAVSHAKRLVVKVGSSLVTNEGKGIDEDAVEQWAAQIASLHAQGKQMVLVSSGAIAEGMARLGWPRRPNAMRSEEHTSELQSLMRISYAVFCLKKKKNIKHNSTT